MFKRRLATLAIAAALFLGIAAPAMAQQEQDGLVNVVITDVTVIGGDVEVLNDLNIGVAANIAANICGVNVKVGPIAVLAAQVDRSGQESAPICTVEGQEVTLQQNN